RELWHEALDRLAEEAPDTLLLAEGFWLMEAYLARNLGMHRVYHGTFMHRLRVEDNTGFRRALVSALAFDRRLAGSFTNYLTNPDEEPAVVQLGKGDKYFALTTLLATLPGLPLFGHGQAEGLVERYGMDYRKARFDEDPDPRFLARHRREIAPLLRKRSCFAEVTGFQLLVFEPGGPGKADDVLAFVNRCDTGAVLVAVHNHGGTTRGRLHRTDATVGGPALDLATALGLDTGSKVFHPWWDPRTGEGWLLETAALARRGLDLDLGPYGTRVMLAGEALHDRPDGALPRLCEELAGRAVSDLGARLDALGYEAAAPDPPGAGDEES
ncbi:MAG: alpha-amylase, partial [Acidobacteria bacterium]|nr:alpha-amylase [Acidobacteriota bacterium]